MAGIGLRKPYIAKYVDTDGVISYTSGQLLAKAVEFSSTIETSSDNELYADDAVVESDKSFAGGTLEVTTDDIEQAAAALLLGITASDLTVGLDTVSELIYNDDMSAPDLGFGIIIPKKKAGVMSYRAVVFTRIKFDVPEEAAKTQGKTIEWQTPKISATIMRDGSEKRAWKREATLTSEADAVAYIKEILDIV